MKRFWYFNLCCLYSTYGSGVLGLIAWVMGISKQKDSRIYYNIQDISEGFRCYDKEQMIMDKSGGMNYLSYK